MEPVIYEYPTEKNFKGKNGKHIALAKYVSEEEEEEKKKKYKDKLNSLDPEKLELFNKIE